MFAECRITHDPEIETAVRKRYATAISELEASGCSYAGALETEHHLPLLPIAFVFGLIGREPRRWKSPFRISWYHPLMRSADGSTLVYQFGVGTQLYTFFEDGSAHRTTASWHTESTRYLKYCNLFVANVNVIKTNVAQLLNRHLGFVEQYRVGGKAPLQSAVQKLVQIQTAEDSRLALIWMACMGWGGPIYVYSICLQKLLAA